MFPFATVSLSIHFRAHPSLSPPLPAPPSLVRNLSPVARSSVEFNRPISLSQFDVCEKIKTSRKRRRRKRKRANSSLPRKRYRRPRNAPETKSVSQPVSDRISSNKKSNVSPTIYQTPDSPSGYRFYRAFAALFVSVLGWVFGTLFDREEIEAVV